MGEGPITIIPQGRNFGDKSVEELEALLDNLTPDGDIPREPEPVPVETPPVETPPVETPVEVAPVEATPETIPEVVAEPEVDLVAMAAEQANIEKDRLQAQLEKLMLHNSRLAGQIGELKKSQVRAGTEYPEIPQEDERIVELRNGLTELRDAQRSEARQRVISGEIQAMLAKPYLKGVDPSFVAAATAKFQQAWDEAVAEDDPELARVNAKTVLLSVAAEARQAQIEKVSSERRAATVSANILAKKAQTPSGSGSVPTPPPKPKSFKDMTAAEADAWLRANVQ